jgi:peptidoglycan hydrolase-like protein with peptidoglycan-binding domain
MLVFRAEAEYAPYTVVRLTIPGGSGGLRDARGALLTSTVTRSFTVAGGSELRLQQLLAELGYLPLSFTRSTSAGSSSGGAGLDAAAGAGATASGPVTEAATGLPATPAIAAEPRQADRIDLAPVPGRFSWRWSGVPAALSSLWSAGTANVVTRGAVMAFEAEEGLTVDGDAGPMVWQALLGAVASRHLDPAPYDWISVSEAAPETLTVWQDGQTLFHVEANTGIAQAPTAPGTFPVYARYLVTTMSGTNPDGSKYKDPGIPHVAYFNGGDAIHGFIRAGYGYPQSLGCVELTYADAARVWQYDQLGTLVTVS